MTSLYVHIPFCVRKCFYCSFVVAVGQTHRVDDYLHALAEEAKRYPQQFVQTVYLGGGTPTFLNLPQIENLFSFLRNHFKIYSDAEWTIEANPEGVDLAKAKLLKSLGVNRISLGIQSLNDKHLKYLGRNHDAKLACETFSILRQAGFDNISVDLMVGFPNQTMEELKSDLRKFIQLDSEHLSIYALTIEPHSRFYVKKVSLPEEKIQVEQYLWVADQMQKTGFKQYEVSNFAKKGKESEHNLNYWHGGNYVGLGIGAHSHLDGKRFWNIPRLVDYIERIKNHQSVIEEQEQLSPHERFMETFLFGLRMNDGVCLAKLEERFGCKLDNRRRELVAQLVKDGYLWWDRDFLKTYDRGRLVLDEISAKLI